MAITTVPLMLRAHGSLIRLTTILLAQCIAIKWMIMTCSVSGAAVGEDN